MKGGNIIWFGFIDKKVFNRSNNFSKKDTGQKNIWGESLGAG